jgi:hypothetical protein
MVCRRALRPRRRRSHRLCWPSDISKLANPLELNLARTGSSTPPGPQSGEDIPEAVDAPTLGRHAFAKISEVEGIRLDDEMKAAFAEFDAKGLSHDERRRAIIGRFKRAAR